MKFTNVNLVASYMKFWYCIAIAAWYIACINLLVAKSELIDLGIVANWCYTLLMPNTDKTKCDIYSSHTAST